MPPTLPQGFGTFPARTPPPTIDPGLQALQEIAERVAGPVVSRRVPISLASGASQYFPQTQDVINCITVTVANGDLWIYAGARNSGPPDFRVMPGDSQQYQLAPNMYDWTWLANGAQTDATVTLQNL